MGARLYPMTDDPAVLERLAEVSTGTGNQLQAMDRYMALVDDGPAENLAVFESEGWKRLSAKVTSVGAAMGTEVLGGYNESHAGQ